MRPTYESREVEIPADFLVAKPPDGRPVTAAVIDWTETALPENAGRYAVVLDHVLSPSECARLLRMAEDSVADRGRSGTRTWSPALVNVGGGWEVLSKSYRNSDRIIWDNQTIMDRLWARCAEAPGVREQLAVVQEPVGPSQRRKGITKGNRWSFAASTSACAFSSTRAASSLDVSRESFLASAPSLPSPPVPPTAPSSDGRIVSRRIPSRPIPTRLVAASCRLVPVAGPTPRPS